MVDLNNFAISVEELASYFDGNVSSDEANRIEESISSEPDLSEIVSVSKEVDADMEDYVNDEFAVEADMSMLDEMNIELPEIDLLSEEHNDFDNSTSLDDVSIDDANLEEVRPFDISNNDDNVSLPEVENHDDSFVSTDDPQYFLSTSDEPDSLKQDPFHLEQNDGLFS